MTVTLRDGTEIEVSSIIAIKPIKGSNEYASYDVYLNGVHTPFEVFEADTPRETLIASWKA